MADPIVFAGNVEWSGENPGISLKETPDGPFVALASFFRVVLSPHGRGHALVLCNRRRDQIHPPGAATTACTETRSPRGIRAADSWATSAPGKGRPARQASATRR